MYSIVKLLILANQSHAKSLIISKLKAKCKEASEELKVLELREAEIDHKQQILRDLKQTIERNVTRKSTRKKNHIRLGQKLRNIR